MTASTTVKYEVEVDNRDAALGADEKPWTANLYLVHDDHTKHHAQRIMLTTDSCGIGATVEEALADMLSALPVVFEHGDAADPCLVNAEDEGRIAHQVSDGSCDQCGAKNFN